MDDKSSPDENKSPAEELDDFTPKETVEEDTERSLNRNTGKYATQSVVYSLLLLITGIGFTIGAIISGTLIGGTLCIFEVMNMFTSDLGATSGGDIFETAEDQFMMCARRSVFSPVTLLAGVCGGIFSAIPSYKLAKYVSSGTHLRSLI